MVQTIMEIGLSVVLAILLGKVAITIAVVVL
jgi:hypothetical protein